MGTRESTLGGSRIGGGESARAPAAETEGSPVCGCGLPPCVRDDVSNRGLGRLLLGLRPELGPRNLGEEAQLVDADWGGVLTTEGTGRLWGAVPWTRDRDAADDAVEDDAEGEGEGEDDGGQTVRSR